ncbi:hypothetical protein TNCV_4949661 [Trichonephila clavipes]|nr:hypothetical protein TNCV_4949661 [Trichonephila clavipes]
MISLPDNSYEKRMRRRFSRNGSGSLGFDGALPHRRQYFLQTLSSEMFHGVYSQRYCHFVFQGEIFNGIVQQIFFLSKEIPHSVCDSGNPHSTNTGFADRFQDFMSVA